MKKSFTPACLGFFRRAKLLQPIGVGVVKVSGEVEFFAAVSFPPLMQCIEMRGQCESSHADDRRGEVGGNTCNQGVKDWEANLSDQGQGEAERQDARCRRVFVEGREDTKPKSKYLIFLCATYFDAIFLEDQQQVGNPQLSILCEVQLVLALLCVCQIKIRLCEEFVGFWSTNPSNLIKPLFVVHLL